MSKSINSNGVPVANNPNPQGHGVYLMIRERKPYYFRYVVWCCGSFRDYTSYKKASALSKQLNTPIVLTIFAHKNIYHEPVDESVINYSNQIKPFKAKLIASFHKCFN